MASQGDIRVLLALDLVLSFLFSAMVISGLAFIDVVPFTWGRVLGSTVVLALLTYLAVLRRPD